MDETTFQHSLRDLKQRVSAMSNNPQPTSSTCNAIHNNLFNAQLRDVRTRLDIMQGSLLEQAAPPPQKPTDRESFEGLSLKISALLRCHRETNDRISWLEQAVSGLQSNVIFTPDSSEMSIEDLNASREAYSDFVEPKSAIAAHDLFVQQRQQDGSATLSQVLQESSTGYGMMPQPFVAACPANVGSLGGHAGLLESLGGSATLSNSGLQLHYHSPAESTGDSQEYLPEQASQTATLHDHQIKRLHDIIQRQTKDFEAKLTAKDAVISHINTLRKAAEEASQITRTDLEARLAERENQLARWKDEAKASQDGFEAMTRCNRELQEARDHAIDRLRHDLKQCELSRHHFMTKYVDENYRFKWLEQRKLQSEQKLQQQLDDCERALDISERNRDADIQRAVQSRDRDVEQLYAFCHEKAALVSHQEQVIAQGTTILHERDAEIDRLNVALTESQRGREYVGEWASRLRHTIKRREKEIDGLKRVHELERDRLEDARRKDADAKKVNTKDIRSGVDERQPSKPLLPFTQATEAVSNGRPMREQTPWTPQPISSSRLPHEEDRAALWQDGAPSAPEHRFGSPSPIARRTRKDLKDDKSNDRGSRVDGDADVKHFNVHKSSANLTPHNNPTHQQILAVRAMKGRRGTNSGTSTSENRRHALPPHATWPPPLPVVEKMSSAPNLRAASGHGDGAISKPASMLELRPQTYQAPCVETEAESAEELGGSSL
jgi:hypothetical protein